MFLNTEVLQLNLIKSQIAQFANFSLGKDLIINQEISDSSLWISHQLQATNQMHSLINKYVDFPVDIFIDITSSLDYLDKGITLTSNQLLSLVNHLNGCKLLSNYQKSIDGDYDVIEDYLSSVIGNDQLISEISKLVLKDGSFNYLATAKLRELDLKKRQLKDSLTNVINRYLKEHSDKLYLNNTVMIDNRYCLNIKNSYKNTMLGITHGESNSGLSVYFEPKAFIDINNKSSDV
ncbi:MAG: hypothetical protein WBO70_04570, partial [Erysipelotrichaceae bacterium]